MGNLNIFYGTGILSFSTMLIYLLIFLIDRVVMFFEKRKIKEDKEAQAEIAGMLVFVIMIFIILLATYRFILWLKGDIP